MNVEIGMRNVEKKLTECESFEKQLIFLISRRVSNFSKMSTEISEKFTREWSAEA
jgi:hypothetical protein